jgi:hypothetical protein
MSMEACAAAAKTAADADRFSSTDKAQNDTLEFWCATVLHLVKQRAAQHPAEVKMPCHFAMFVGFLVETLMSKACFVHLPVFAAWLKDMAMVYPESLSKMHRALLTLSEADLASNEAVVIHGLSEARHHKFVTCPLYKDFLRSRNQHKFHHVRAAHSLPDVEREALISSLWTSAGPDGVHDTRLSEEQCNEMQMVKTLLGTNTSMKCKIAFVMNDPTHFLVLGAWAPEHPLLDLKWFTETPPRWKQCTVQTWLRAVRLLALSPEAVAKVVGPAKVIVLEYMKLLEVTRHATGDVPEEDLRQVADFAVHELAVARLGLQGPAVYGGEGASRVFARCPTVAKDMHKVLGVQIKKFEPVQHSTLGAIAIAQKQQPTEGDLTVQTPTASQIVAPTEKTKEQPEKKKGRRASPCEGDRAGVGEGACGTRLRCGRHRQNRHEA